jgi:hypothetical protein
MIKNHDIFKSPRKMQAPVGHQLMMLLCFLGMEGNGMNDGKGRSVFCASKGTIRCYKDRVVQAILDCLYDAYIRWPDQADQRIIAERIRAEFGLPNYIGVADGTLLPLAFWPSTDDYVNCKGRKMLCMLKMPVLVNDDQRRIWHFNAGWPRSTHNDRVFQKSRIVKDLDDYFLETEYIIGDSAYGPQTFMVSVYKKPVGPPLYPDNKVFNKKLAKPRMSFKHTIGIWKGRFPSLSPFRCNL